MVAEPNSGAAPETSGSNVRHFASNDNPNPTQGDPSKVDQLGELGPMEETAGEKREFAIQSSDGAGTLRG